MPAPPSSRQTAAKNASVAARNAPSTTQTRSGNGKMSSSSTQTGGVSTAPDPRSKVGVLDAPRLSADPTNGIGIYRGQVVSKTPGPRVNLPASRPDPRFNVGVIDTPRLSADPTNGIGRVNPDPSAVYGNDQFGNTFGTNTTLAKTNLNVKPADPSVFDLRSGLSRTVAGEPSPGPYGADPFGTTNLVRNPQTTMLNSYPNIAGRVPATQPPRQAAGTLTTPYNKAPEPFRNGVPPDSQVRPSGGSEAVALSAPPRSLGQPTNILNSLPGFNSTPDMPRPNQPLRQAITGGPRGGGSSVGTPYWRKFSSR